MDKIAAFLPSFDRACQLRLLLESVQRNCPNAFRFYILRKASNEKFHRAYEQLEREKVYGDVHCVWEDDHNKQLREFFRCFAGEYCSLWTDDCVFYRGLHADSAELESLFRPDVWSVSLRLGLNTRCHNYLTGHQMAPLFVDDEFNQGKYIAWDFKVRDRFENYGYYFGWDSMTYRTQEVRNLLEGGYPFESVRHVEVYAVNCGGRERIPYRKLVSPRQSVVLCQQVNATHTMSTCTGTRFSAPLGELNDCYLAGKCIDLDSMDVSGVNGCHQEIPFLLRKL